MSKNERLIYRVAIRGRSEHSHELAQTLLISLIIVSTDHSYKIDDVAFSASDIGLLQIDMMLVEVLLHGLGYRQLV